MTEQNLKSEILNRDFSSVTEMEGQKVSFEQLQRTAHRYHWALQYVSNKDVIEVACGSGPGLELLATKAKSLKAGDISEPVLQKAKQTYGNRFDLQLYSAEELPYEDNSADVILLFEAIYYIDADKFLNEAIRVLRPGGHILVATANCALFDFTPSPFAKKYYNSNELIKVFQGYGFKSDASGYLNINETSLRQRVLRPVKLLASRLNLIPKTMHGKEFLKKVFFGTMVTMPSSILTVEHIYTPPTPLKSGTKDNAHKVIYCSAQLQRK
jgi:ubiquinone/menaquinone biosynthesis C-methylase UbiE